MRLKSVRGVQAHNFDTDYVHSLLEKGDLELEDALYILSSANNVILGLRSELNQVIYDINVIKERLDSGRNSLFMKGKK
jgi:exonuclease VII small subunit